jgi:hypothetical protein
MLLYYGAGCVRFQWVAVCSALHRPHRLNDNLLLTTNSSCREGELPHQSTAFVTTEEI